jgi:MscS family membrane protein
MQFLDDWLSKHLGLPGWVASLVVIALLTVAVNQVAQVALRHAGRATAATRSVWDDALVASAGRPLLLALWVIGLGFMARVLQSQTEAAFLQPLLALRDVALIACAAWFLQRFVGRVRHNVVSQRQARGEEVDHTTIDALGKLATLVVIVVAVLVTAQTLGFQIGGLLALGGVGGLAVGLAAKDLLANFFGGLTIYLDRPFAVGEWIRSPDKDIEGVVEHISWRHTRIRAFNKNPVYVPNAVFTTIVVENPTRMSHRRLRTTIGLRYDDFAVVAPIVAEIRALLQAHPGIDTSQALIVNFTGYGASSLDILVNAFSKTTSGVEFFALQQELLLAIGELIARHGAEIAFPTQTLHLQDVAGAAEAAGVH